MSEVRARVQHGSARPGGALKGYPPDALHREIAFLAYYLHWDYATIIELEHRERQRWCAEVSAINQKINGDDDGRSIETLR